MFLFFRPGSIYILWSMAFYHSVTCFFNNVAPNGKYFISPLRINGSAIESVYGILKISSGGNLSALSYGPSLGKLINSKDMKENKNSEKGYSDVVLNINGIAAANVACSRSDLVITCQRLSNCLCIFTFKQAFHSRQLEIGLAVMHVP